MAKTKRDQQFDAVLAEYKRRYNVETLDSPNDLSNLHIMIKNQLLIEQLQDAMSSAEGEDQLQAKKRLDSIVALSEVNMQLERTLGIDRKTRKQDSTESVADYITGLKQRAYEWLESEERLIKVYCPHCNIMVGRISGVYDTTAYEAMFQCPQCDKGIKATRKERDVFFDVKDADWRRKYPIEIKQPKRTAAPELTIDDDVMLGDYTVEEENGA